MKEVIRCKKVHDGVAHAAKLYPSGYIIMAMVGTIKGRLCGSSFFVCTIVHCIVHSKSPNYESSTRDRIV